jgi:hypothetical protein
MHATFNFTDFGLKEKELKFEIGTYIAMKHHRELSKVFDFLKIVLRTVLVFLVFHINIFKNYIFVHFFFVFYILGKNKAFMEKLFS